MPIPNILIKKPLASIQYSIDISNRLASGETISSVTASVSPTGLTVNSPTSSGAIAQFRATGTGTEGVLYTITLRFVTSSSNVLYECVKLFIEDCSWLTEMVVMLRYVINDLGSTPDYSDVRLAQTLCVAAQLVLQEISFSNTYTINVANLTMIPDPTQLATPDTAFMNFCVLRAACMIDQSSLRTKALVNGIRANLGPLMLDTNGHIAGFLKTLELGVCKTYADMKFQYAAGDSSIVQAVLSPFVSNDYDPLSVMHSYRDLGQSVREPFFN